jgi:putative addiction module component (TIGR02574 family)
MSKAEILAELPKLPVEDRAEIQAKLDELAGDGWLDADDPLTDAEKALIESRIEAHEKNPDAAIPWEVFDARLKRRLG